MKSLPLLQSFVLFLFALALLSRPQPATAQVFGCTPPAANAIACENSKTGNPASEWDLGSTQTGDSSIQGFATDISVNQGATVHFKVNTNASAYRIDIYRIGYYGGMGARKIASILPSVTLPQSQPACLKDASTLLIDCGNWSESASWAVPPDATSGIYIARLVRSDNGGANHMVFIVRADNNGSQILFQTSDATWQAYNDYGGDSFYAPSYPTTRAYKVSYNRPFVTRERNPLSWFMSAEYPMIRWLEANGYDLSYSTGIDTDRNGSLIIGHQIFLSVGHDEYWSKNQRSNVSAALAAGVHLGFFSGNEIFWKTRWENSIDGSNTPYRTLVCYKETLSGTRLDPLDPPTWTGTWRDPTFSPPADGGFPENALSGTISYVNAQRNDAIAVPFAYSKLRFWRNTAVAKLSPGATYTSGNGTLGYEWDEELDNGFRPAGLIDLSSTTLDVSPDLLLDYGATQGNGTATHNLALYRAASGALVFGAGTVQWSWALDSHHDQFSFQPPPPDINLEQATVNILADMGSQPATLQPGLSAASSSTDTAPPASSITSPTNGSTVHTGSALTITGTAADTGGGIVAVVEVSVDGGSTWHRATGQQNWTYSWTPTVLGSATIKSRAVDDSVNIETPSAGVTVSVTPAGLVSLAVTPANSSISPGASQQFTATGTFSDGSKENLTNSATWSSSNTNVATINATGLAIGGVGGGTTIQASLGGVTGSTGLTVTSAILQSIAVTPANASLAQGSTQQFVATGTFSDGSTQNLTASVSWSSTNTAVATIASSGFATCIAAGNTSIQATLGSISGSTSLVVTGATPGLLAYWKFDEGAGTKASDSSGNNHAATLVNAISWSTGKVGQFAVTAHGTNDYIALPAIDMSTTKAVTVTFWLTHTYSTAGGHTLFENSANFNNSTTGFGFFPDDSSCSGILVGLQGDNGYSVNCYAQPSSTTWHHFAVIFDKSQTGSAETAVYVDGVIQAPKRNYLTTTNSNNFGNNATYVFSRGGTQEFTAGTIDDLRIYNRVLSSSDVQSIYSYTGANLVSIAVTPANASLPKGKTQQFLATGTYSDGSTQNLTSSAAWSSSITAVATITAAGLATAAGIGNTSIQAAVGSISGSTNFSVTAPVLLSLAVTPANISLAKGGSQQYAATGTFSDGSTQDVSASVTWSSSNTSVAGISSTGLASALGVGNTTIAAASGQINGTTNLNVTSTLVSLAISPANGSLPKGKTQQFTAVGTYSDGSTQDITSSVAWSSSATSIATITNTGFASAVGLGGTSIQAALGTVNNSTTFTVTAPVLVSIAVGPANSSIAKGTTQQFTATGTFSDQSSQDLTNSVVWSSSNQTAATISSSGLASAVATGSSTIQAASGAITGSTTFTVAAAALVSIAVAPASPSIAKGLTQQFLATGTYTDGSTQNLTTTAKWSSAVTTVATISASGLATGTGVGTSSIQAASGSITGSTTLTVTPAVLVSISVTPANSSIVNGASLQFTANGTYTDGSSQNLTSSVVWTSSANNIVSISSSGLATALALGSTTIQAAAGSISGSTGLTVSATISGLVGRWAFDDGAGTTAVDSSGNGHSITLVNGVTWTAGEAGDAITAASASKQYAKTPALNLSTTKAVTVTLWAKRIYSTAGGTTLFENSTNFNNSTTGFGFFPDDSSCNGLMVGERGDAGYNINCYAQPSSGVWHHFAAVFDKSQPAGSEVTLYTDGVLQTPSQHYLSAENTNAFGSNVLYLFSRGGSSEFNSGSIDDLQIFNRALSAGEVQQIYNSAGK
ncbi:MAG: Ig-like domain-containing protein [Acidobacteria bacterium]|nr:Ig-like domain-containing protein [Acidobacteriota bacterium]